MNKITQNQNIVVLKVKIISYSIWKIKENIKIYEIIINISLNKTISYKKMEIIT